MIRKTHAALLALFAALPALANSPPAAPTITEPSTDGKIVNPADVHMETAPFSDPDPFDTHLCTDWEIWTAAPSELVWLVACIGGVERVHVHLGDGVFTGSYTGRSELEYDTDYILRVRHRDSSGDPLTEWSDWSQRSFRTGSPTAIFAMNLDDIAPTPPPQWLDPIGSPIILPPAGSPPALRLESAAGDLLLEFRANDGTTNLVTNPPALAGHVNLRLRLDAAGAPGGLVLAESRVLFTDAHGADQTVYLPGLNLPAGTTAWYWVSANGSTFVASPAQTEPDFSVLARGAPVPWAVRQPGFQVEVLATGFQLPVNIAFVPNPGVAPDSPEYYVTELYGMIKVVTRSGMVSDYATDLLNFNPTGNFPGSGEHGLTGVVVDPISGDVFATVLYDSATSPGTHYPKVLRFHSDDGGLTAATTTTILDMVGETQGQSHQISNLTIGPDGKLYVHMGDGFDASTAQNLGSFRGKILRLNLDGSAPSDNPFYNASDGITARDYVYAYGFRNPFGGGWRALDGSHYEAENGPSVDRLAQVIAGRNYLWDGTDASMANFAIYNWSPAAAPVNIAFVQAATFSGSGFPAGKMDHLFVSESGPTYATGPQTNGKRISEFVLDAAGNRISGPTPLIEYNGVGKATVSALAAGPDGLYFSDLYKDLNYVSPIDRGANILRVKFVGTADFSANVATGPAPLIVQFTDLSNVPGAAAWSWDFGDGGASTLQNPAHTYVSDGVYDVRLTTTGTNGAGVVQKPGFIRVGQFSSIAMICGTLPVGVVDTAIADHLRGLGFTVDLYDDDRANRPAAGDLAAGHDLVIVSSTVTSANVAGDFSTVPVPLVYWEQGLNRTDREPLATSGGTVAGVQSISVTASGHPILAAIPTGSLQVYSAPATMSYALAPLGTGVQALATVDGQPGNIVILAADTGAALLNGRTAPARRVFLFLEDAGWSSTNETGKRLFRQAVYWALGQPLPTVAPDFDHDLDVDADDLAHFQACMSGPAVPQTDVGCYDARLDGDDDVDLDDFGILQRCLSSSGVQADANCAG